jgi:hypothetical protein
MAGTAKSYDSGKIILGPGDLWLNVAVPSAAARLTVDTTSNLHTPDATANPNAVHLGMTKGGTVVSYKPTTQSFEADEITSPYLARMLMDDLSIKGEMLQVFDFALLKQLTVGGTFATGTGYEEIAVGGLSAVPTISVALIVPDLTTPGTYYTVVQVYKTFNSSGWDFNVTRKDPAAVNFEFKGLSITTRTAGDQVGKIWKKIA